MTEAVNLAPHALDHRLDLGYLLAYVGRVDEAVIILEQTVRLWPDWAEPHEVLRVAYEAKGDAAGARREREALDRITPRQTPESRITWTPALPKAP